MIMMKLCLIFVFYCRDALLEMESCSHPTVMRDLCAECGADLSNEKQTASVPMVHCVPDLKVSIEVNIPHVHTVCIVLLSDSS